ncbi:hypothetical protein L1887_48908 [Cichorium endivia]|nr:hypothetical protein L1887_48908 [Cichorium endivia]
MRPPSTLGYLASKSAVCAVLVDPRAHTHTPSIQHRHHVLQSQAHRLSLARAYAQTTPPISHSNGTAPTTAAQLQLHPQGRPASHRFAPSPTRSNRHSPTSTLVSPQHLRPPPLLVVRPQHNAKNYSRPTLDHAHTQPFHTLPHSSLSLSLERDYLGDDHHHDRSHSSKPDHHHGISSSFDDDELRQILSRSPIDHPNNSSSFDGDVAKADGPSRAHPSSNHAAFNISIIIIIIVSSSSSSSSSSNDDDDDDDNGCQRGQPGHRLSRHPHPSHAEVLAPRTSPLRAHSTRSVRARRPRPPPPPPPSTAPKTPPPKSPRNPFGFLKKKPSSQSSAHAASASAASTSASASASASASSSNVNLVRNEPSIASLSSRYGSNAANLNPMRPPAWLDNNHSRSLASSVSPSSASLRSHYHQPPASIPTPWQNPLNSRIDSLPAAISLEDELESEHRDAKKEARKRIKGVRHHLAKASDRQRGTDDTGDPSLSSQSHSIQQEVELSLDMNFDQLEDFVDTNAARQRLQGSSVTDAASTSTTSPSDHRSPSASESGLPHHSHSPSPSPSDHASPSNRHTSLSTNTDSASQLSDASASQRASSSRNTASISTSSSTSTILSDRRPSPTQHAAPQQRPPRQPRRDAKLPVTPQTIEQPQRHAPSASYSPSTSSLPVRRDSMAAALATSDSALPATPPPLPPLLPPSLPSAADSALADQRKDSVVSAHSLRSDHSGISPKTSYANLSVTAHERHKAAAAAAVAAVAAAASSSATPSASPGWAAAPPPDKHINGRADHALPIPARERPGVRLAPQRPQV